MKEKQELVKNLWGEVEKALAEETASGYKIACLEAEKVFKQALILKKYPTENLEQTITLYGWKLTNKEGLKKALQKTKEIKESVDFRLSTFEAEDIIEVFRQAVTDFESAKPLSWERKLTLMVEKNLSPRSFTFKKSLALTLGFFLIIKFLAHTALGNRIINLLVAVSDFIYSWFILFILISISVFVFVIMVFASLDRKGTRIKSIK